jgi:dihydropteridine reductase
MKKYVVILGSNGALGRAVSSEFKRGWNRILCDVSDRMDDSSLYVKLELGMNASDQFRQLEQSIVNEIGKAGKLDAIINVGGGFRMDNAASEEIFENLQQMYSSSVESTLLSAHLASKFLKEDGFLLLPGAACVAKGGPTPWAVSYGAMKSAVHQIIKSLAQPASGLPQTSKVAGIAPVC